jgi:hypothetical protein
LRICIYASCYGCSGINALPFPHLFLMLNKIA